jgi:hypothetical protein
VKRYKKAPHLLAVLQPQGQLQRADLHAPLPPGYGQRGAQRLPARVPHQAHLAQEPSGGGQHQRQRSQGEKTKALKEIEKITKMIAEMEEYEREVLYPLATEQVEIDLDDGVKVNYPKLGAALKKMNDWDRMESALQSPEFWYFLNKSEYQPETRIDLLFRLIIGRPDAKSGYSVFRIYNENFRTDSLKDIEL